MPIQIILLIVLAVAAVFLLHSRFSHGQYGKLRPNQSVGEAFESFRVKDHMQYFSSGPHGCPNAIMAIEKTWVLMDDLWKKEDLSQADMKQFVQGMQGKGVPLFGFDLVDRQERKIGEWFSVLDTQTTIFFPGGNRVSVATPPVDTYPPLP
jgi:hypothetical protein